MRSSPINISVLGSTGSIGTQTLEVVDQFPNLLHVIGLAAGSNLHLLQKQVEKYHPKSVSVKKEGDANILKKQKKSHPPKVYWGDEGNCNIATLAAVDKVVIATSGLAGIKPTLAAIRMKKTIALATKEVLVAAGDIVMHEALRNKVQILPIDSEHSAIFQCLGGRTVQ